MKSDVISVSSRYDTTAEAIEQAEKVAVYGELSHKEALHLRLLAEEMMSMIRAIAGEVSGQFWIQNRRSHYELHLLVDTAMDEQKRKALLSTSKTGKNEANRGFMGKIRAFFEPMEDVPIYFECQPDAMYQEISWTMAGYQQKLENDMEHDREGAKAAWDELEKSVIGHIADDVKVSIRGHEVEMIVYKKMD